MRRIESAADAPNLDFDLPLPLTNCVDGEGHLGVSTLLCDMESTTLTGYESESSL
jgi:hypothetical protein